MERAGFTCVGAVDHSAEAIKIFKANFPQVRKIIQSDITELSAEALEGHLQTNFVDIIVGGPPCQGFSQARQVDGSNHGPRVVEDPRRHLYREFLRMVGHFRPKAFVIENVLGIRSASGGQYFTRVQAEARALGYRVVPRVEDASKLGVPQMRRRQLFFGVRADLPGFLPREIRPADRAHLGATLGDAIMDLPELNANSGSQEMDYDLEKRKKFTSHTQSHFIYSVLEIDRAKTLTAHESRPHSERDLRDFRRLKEGDNSREAMRRGVEFDFPYDKTTFKDRYTRQHRDRPCSTIVAHLSKDGLMFIHPTQDRSLTPREAARIQTFPDWFAFPVPRTHQYRAIGNAVPPLVSEAVGNVLANLLKPAKTSQVCRTSDSGELVKWTTLPSSREEAVIRLMGVALMTRPELKSSDHLVFLGGWHSLLYLFPDLHPDNALDHGLDSETVAVPAVPIATGLDLRKRYKRTGWPVALESLGREAWRRMMNGEMTDAEMYCDAAQEEGIRYSAQGSGEVKTP